MGGIRRGDRNLDKERRGPENALKTSSQCGNHRTGAHEEPKSRESQGGQGSEKREATIHRDEVTYSVSTSEMEGQLSKGRLDEEKGLK